MRRRVVGRSEDDQFSDDGDDSRVDDQPNDPTGIGSLGVRDDCLIHLNDDEQEQPGVDDLDDGPWIGDFAALNPLEYLYGEVDDADREQKREDGSRCDFDDMDEILDVARGAVDRYVESPFWTRGGLRVRFVLDFSGDG